MKVNQIKEGTKVSIESLKDNSVVSLDSRICQFTDPLDIKYVAMLRNRYPDKDFCFLEPIHEKQYLIDFASPSVVKNLILIRDAAPFAWERVAILNTNFPVYGRVHMIVTSHHELPHNRRNSYRLRISKPGDFVFHHDDADYRKQVVVNDISASGIGLIMESTKGIYKNQPCKIHFTDGNRFHLKASVRRIVEVDDQHYIVGCIFDSPSEEVGRFVMQKQRQERSQKLTPVRPAF